jgi:hypothetical protein
MNGRKITQIVNEANAKVGRYETFWNGKSERSGDVSSGLYVFRLVIAGKTVQYKAALVK